MAWASSSVREEEAHAKDAPISFERKYPGALNEDNANVLIKRDAEKHEARAAVLEKLRAAQQEEAKRQKSAETKASDKE